MTCDHARCTETATIKTRFGNGFWRHGNTRHRQTYVRYCHHHYLEADKLFLLHDVRLLTEAA